MKPKHCITLLLATGLFLGSNQCLAGSSSIRRIELVGPKTEQVKKGTYSAIYHVSVTTGSDKEGEGSEQKPWQTILFALKRISADPNSPRKAVFVAAGNYSHGTVNLSQYVDLYGGFDPKTWQRDIDQYQTVLDGQGVRRVVLGADSSKIDGFTIANGLALTNGGGLLCDDTSPTITNNRILNNLVAEPLEFNLTRIHQDGNHGGGIACMYNAVPVIKNNLFSGNRTAIGNGGGIAFYGWVRLKDVAETEIINSRMVGGVQARLENNVFIGNIAGINDLSRTRSSNGGAISCAFEARPLIRNNLIIANQARGRGDAGGIYCEYFSYPEIVANWIVANIGDDDGGGIYLMKQSQPLIQDNIIAGNWTLGGGVGGIRLSKEGRAKITGNIIIENPGGAIQIVDSYAELEENIIIKNPDANGVLYSNAFAYMQPSVIRRNIIRENGKGAFVVAKNAVLMPVFENNNVDDQSLNLGQDNFNRLPEIDNEGTHGNVNEVIYDPIRGQSKVQINQSLSDQQMPTGRIIRIAKRWGIIKGYRDKTFTVWGDIGVSDEKEMTFEILPSYTRP